MVSFFNPVGAEAALRFTGSTVPVEAVTGGTDLTGGSLDGCAESIKTMGSSEVWKGNSGGCSSSIRNSLIFFLIRKLCDPDESQFDEQPLVFAFLVS